MKINARVLIAMMAILMLNSSKIMGQFSFPQANILFGHHSNNQDPCTGTGLCGTGGTAGATAAWNYPPPATASSWFEAIAFNLRSGVSSGKFIAPQTTPCNSCPNDDPCACGTYSIDSMYTFSGDDGTGIPKGWFIPAGTQASYTYDNTTAVACISFYVFAPGTSSAKQKSLKVTPEQKKKDIATRNKAMQQAAEKMKKKK